MTRRILAVLGTSLFIAVGARAQDPSGGSGTPGVTQPQSGGNAPATGLSGSAAGPAGAQTPGAPGKGPGKGGSGSPFGGGFGGGMNSSGFGLQQPGMPGMGTGFGGGMGFGGGVMGGGSAKKEKDLKKMTLDELLAKALKDNPDLRVAEAKVREAEAELNRTRLQVLQKVAKVYQEIALARQIVDGETRQLERLKALGRSGAVSQEELGKTELAVERAKAEVAKLEAELPYLVGKQPGAAPTMTGTPTYGDTMNTPFGSSMGMPGMPMGGMPMGMPGMPSGLATKPVPTNLADKVRAALDTPIKGEFRDSQPREIVEWLSTSLKGINVHLSAKVPNIKVSIKLTESIPVGAALQWLEDEFGWRCVLRDYGVVITERDAVPPGATPLLEFWKQRPKETKEKGTN
jgi:hypothetical protein